MFKNPSVSLALLAAVVISTSSFAGVGPIQETDVRAQAAVSMANDVFQVKQVRASDGMSYKIVEMDSGLNGDLTSTIIVLVGQDVGGAAGYDKAFQIGPNLLAGMTSAKVQGDRVVVTGPKGPLSGDAQTSISIKYNASTGILSTR